MTSYVFSLFIIPLLWQTCFSTHECNRTIVEGNMTFLCPQNVSNQLLRLNDLTSDVLENITVFIAKNIDGINPGPFTSIPPNICLMQNLKTVIFSNNRIVTVDPTDFVSTCFNDVVTLDLSRNSITTFPSYLIYNMPNLKNLYFQYNNLTDIPVRAFPNVETLEIIDFSYNHLTTFELWALDVKTKADFSYNSITTITNQYFYTSTSNRTTSQGIFLTGNGPTINFTDAIYEMYYHCDEVQQWYYTDNEQLPPPLLTGKISSIEFGTTLINCNCDQLYFLRVFADSYTTEYPYRILNTMCSNSSQNVTNTRLFNSSCFASRFDRNSTLNFSQIYPRFCKIQETEPGAVTESRVFPVPSSNASTYPHYEVADMSLGTCFFTFTSATAMTVSCTNDTSNTLSQMPGSLLNNSYMTNITRVTFTPIISTLPKFICSLPSHEIDLSYQAFTVLSDTTFSCLDSFRKVSLSHNQLMSVNISNGNLQNLTSLDLSSNQLTTIPYSVLIPTPTSLRSLDLRNNSINYIDLFVYTRKNITIYLDNNPINSTKIINPQNATLSFNTTSTANVTFPVSVTNSTIIIADSIAITYGVCNDFQSLRNLLLSLDSTGAVVLLDCTCNSINLKQMYSNHESNILNDFDCSNLTQEASFALLTTSSCSSSANFSSGLCSNETSGSNSTGVTTQSPSGNTTTTTVLSNVTTTTTASGSGNTTTTTTTQSPFGTTVEGGGTTTSTTTTTASGSGNTTTTTVSFNATTTTTTSGSANATTTTTASGSANATTTTTASGSGNTTTTTTTQSPFGTTVEGGGTTTSTTTTTASGSGNTTTTTVLSNATTTTTASGSANITTTTTTQSPFGTTAASGGTTTSTTSTSQSQSNTTTTVGNTVQSSGSTSDSNRTGLIVGLVVGIGGFFILLAALIAALILCKRCKGGGGKNTRSNKDLAKGKSAPDGQKSAANHAARLQSRNPRGIQLATNSPTSSRLPSGPVGIVVPDTHLTSPNNNPNLRRSARGIPLRLEPLRQSSGMNPLSPPTTSTMSNPTTLRSTNSLQMNPPSFTQPPNPIPPHVLNIGGDVRF